MKRRIVLFLVIVMTAGLAQAQDITTGLQGYWPFEEGSGTTTADVSGKGNTGTLVGTPTWDNGPGGFGGALFFDVGASGDGVNCGEECNPIEDTGQFSFALWAYWRGTEVSTHYEHQYLVCKGYWGYDATTYHAGLGGPLADDARKNRLLFHSSKNTPTSITFPEMPKNVWVHLVFTFDGTNLALYMDGTPDGTGPHPFIIGTPEESTGKLIIGESFDLNERSFDGYIDEVRVYNRVLSAYDIQALLTGDPDFNFPPQVDAGDYQSLLWPGPGGAIQLDGYVDDDGKPNPPGAFTSVWSKLSGPGTADFSDTGIADPTVTFSAAGFYKLQLSASDGEKDACSVVDIYVRPDDNPIARWNFEEGTETTVGDSSAFNNVGTFVGEPNWVAGWVDDWALECADNAYVNITVDPAADPNLDSLQYEITVATWVKVDSWLTSSSWNGIVTKGDGREGGVGGWSLIRNSSNDSLAFYTPGAGFLGGSISVKDGNWHHVAAVHDGVTTALYVDGVLDVSSDASGYIGTSTAEIWLNGNYENPGRFFAGLLDDVRIYSYAISESQITELVALGQGVPPTVDAGANETFYMQNGSLQLDATVVDETPPQTTLVWTKESGPGTAQFSDATIEDPTVTFSEPGEYILRLTANDPLAVVYDEVTITVENPTCQDVIDGGLLLPVDISGPAGIPDCHVDIYDFAAFAGNWLGCNNPQDLDCDYPY